MPCKDCQKVWTEKEYCIGVDFRSKSQAAEGREVQGELGLMQGIFLKLQNGLGVSGLATWPEGAWWSLFV